MILQNPNGGDHNKQTNRSLSMSTLFVLRGLFILLTGSGAAFIHLNRFHWGSCANARYLGEIINISTWQWRQPGEHNNYLRNAGVFLCGFCETESKLLYFWIWLTGWDNDSWTRININYDHPQKHPIIEFPSGPDLVKNSTQPKRNLRRKRCVSYHQCHNHWIFPEEHHFKDAEKRSCNDCDRWITNWVGNCLIRKSLRWSWYVAGYDLVKSVCISHQQSDSFSHQL